MMVLLTRAFVCCLVKPSCVDPERFVSGGSNSDNVLRLVDEGRDDPNTTKGGLSLTMR